MVRGMKVGTRKLKCPHCGKPAYVAPGDEVPRALLPLVEHLKYWTAREVEELLTSIKERQWATVEEGLRRQNYSNEHIAKLKADVFGPGRIEPVCSEEMETNP